MGFGEKGCRIKTMRRAFIHPKRALQLIPPPLSEMTVLKVNFPTYPDLDRMQPSGE